MSNAKNRIDVSDLPVEILEDSDPLTGSQDTPDIDDPRLTQSKGRSPAS